MAHSQTKNALIDSFKAGTAITANTIVKHSITAPQTVDLAVAGTSFLMGVALCSGAVGEVVDVQETGTVKLIMGGTVAAGDLIMADADGHGILATAGSYVVGFVKQSAVADQIATVQLNRFKI